jgi:Zn-finger nucleic acid-binding protein
MVEAANDRGDETVAAKRQAVEREVRYLRCPQCQETMSRMNFGKRSGVIVDVCKLHGTWFDAGELDGVLAFVAHGGLATPEAATTTTTPELGTDAAQMVRTAELLMREEALRENAKIEAATELVDDVLFVLFPVERSWAWRSRRRHL